MGKLGEFMIVGIKWGEIIVVGMLLATGSWLLHDGHVYMGSLCIIIACASVAVTSYDGIFRGFNPLAQDREPDTKP